MPFLEVHGVVDEAGRLVLDGPLPLPPGKVRVQVDVAGAEGEDDEVVFRAMVGHSWADSLKDPNEDIYTLNDGKPIDPVTGEIANETR